MAKAGMRRPSPYDADNHGTENHHKMNHPKNEQAQVPEIQGCQKRKRQSRPYQCSQLGKRRL